MNPLTRYQRIAEDKSEAFINSLIKGRYGDSSNRNNSTDRRELRDNDAAVRGDGV